MKIVRMSNDHRYNTSKDYEMLWGLIHETPIVCIVNYGETRDIACSLWHGESVNIGVRGLSYIYSFDFEDFEKQCEKLDLEYIVPHYPRTRY